jgi:competence protein ComEC
MTGSGLPSPVPRDPVGPGPLIPGPAIPGSVASGAADPLGSGPADLTPARSGARSRGRADRPDRRLFGFAGGLWVACLTGLRVGPVIAWAGALLAAVAALVVVVGHLLRQRRPPRPGSGYQARHRRHVAVWAVAGVLLGVVCGFAATAARTAARDAPVLQALVSRHPSVDVGLVIDQDPRPLRWSETVLVPARMTEVVTGERARLSLDVRVLVFARDPAWRGLLPGQRVAAHGRLGPPRGGDLTAAVFTAAGPPEPLAAAPWVQHAAGGLRSGLRQAIAPLPADPGSLVPALAIGDTSGLDPVLEEKFRATGLTHLMAVSGANITIVVGFVMLLARWLRAGPGVAVAVAALALVGFVILVRPSPSVLRAAAMGAVGLLALLVGRSRVATSALATAVIAALLFDPALAVSPGFLLSVLATGALVLLAPGWRDRLRALGVPSGLAEALAVSAAAQAVCAPVIAGLSGQVSLVALPANLAAAPAVAPVTVLGVAAAGVSPVSLDLAGALAWLASWPARWLVLVASVGASVPAAELDWASGWPGALSLAAVVAGVWFARRHPGLRRLVLTVVLAVVAGTLPVRWFAGGWPPAGTVMVACDVGQGDAIVLLDRDGSAVVVDTGPDPASVDACLRRLAVGTVDAVVISHFHADHGGGLRGVLAGRAVGGVVVPTFAEPAEGRAEVREAAAAARVPVLEVGPGWTFPAGDVHLRVLGPTRPLTGTRSDPNNNSLVLLAHVRGVSILLPGDAEVEQQRALLRTVDGPALAVDILKVAHHGSSYQDRALLDATGARIALVSVGAGNPYGHPDAALLRDLADAGMCVVRTDQHGDVAVVATQSGLGVATTRGGAIGCRA